MASLISHIDVLAFWKTTFSGKLAKYLQEKRGQKVMLVAGDVYRPAAIDHYVVGGQVKVPVYTEEGNKNQWK